MHGVGALGKSGVSIFIKMEYPEFSRQLTKLNRIIIDGVAYFAAWKGLMVEDDESAKALNMCRGLFLPARNALLWMSLMQFSKVFDRDQRTPSLSNLARAAKANPAILFPNGTFEELNNIEKEIANKEELLSRLKDIRDKRIAHHDATIEAESSVKYGEFRQLIEDVKGLYNRLGIGHNRNSTLYDFLVRESGEHTARVVQIMREERERIHNRNRTERNRGNTNL